jgi:hypothetical protein
LVTATLPVLVGGYHPQLILVKIKVPFEVSEVGRDFLALRWTFYRSDFRITELNVAIMVVNMISVCLMLSRSLPILQFFLFPLYLPLLSPSRPPASTPNSSYWQMEWISRRKFTTTVTWDGVSQTPLTQPPSFTHDKATLYEKWGTSVLSNDISK